METQSQNFILHDKTTGDISIDYDKTHAYLGMHTSTLTNMLSLTCLIGIGESKMQALSDNDYSEEYEKELMDYFIERLRFNASLNLESVSKEALNSHLTVARQYIQNIGSVSLNGIEDKI